MTIRYGSDCTGLDAPLFALNHMFPEQVDAIFASDTDKYVRQMIDANHSVKNVYEDVAERPVHEEVDVYFAGFPCQSFSTAGARAGFEDTRGTVFFEILNYLSAAKPKIAVLENVKGLLTHDGGMTFRVIMQLLSEIGIYNVYHEVLSPHEHGNWPQYRPRVFIVCIREDAQHSDFSFPAAVPLTYHIEDVIDTSVTGTLKDISPYEQKQLTKQVERMSDKGIDIMDDYYVFDIQATSKFGIPRLNVSPTLKARRTRYFVTKLCRKLTLDESRHIQGLPEMSVVVSDTQYEKQIGNSVCVPVLIRLFTQIFQCVNIK